MSLIETAIEMGAMVKFYSYYKYSFTFIGEYVLDNGETLSISASMGGNSEDIYRLEVVSGVLLPLNKEDFKYISVTNKTTGEKETYFNDN